MPRCPKTDKDDNQCNGFVFYPEFGQKRCSNVLCDWNLQKRRVMWEEDT